MKKILILILLGAFLLPHIAKAGEWHEKIKLKGDFRHRHELIQEGNKEDRNRWRIRFRLSLEGEVTDEWSVGTRFATGSSDPVSTNQTLDGGLATKGFHLDRAYFDFHPQAVKGLHVIGGKFGVPFAVVEKTELIWDGDLSPEGAAIKYKNKAHEKVEVLLSGALFYLEERGADDDTWMAGGQLGCKVEPAEDMHFMVGGGYYDYREVKERPGLYEADDFFGNTYTTYEGEEDTFEVYANDYNLFETFGEFGVSMEKVSLKVYGNFVTNTEADSLNNGWLIGGTVKYGKDRGNVKVYANWREIEDDAVIGAFTDSDFRGGGTDGNGLEAGVSVGVAKSVDLALTYFFNNKGIDEEVEYKRLQADVKMKF